MCDVDGLTCPRDCFDVGFGSGYTGEPLERLWASLAADGVTESDLADWQRANLEEGWHAGRADFEAFTAAPVRDEPPPVTGDDEIPW